MYPQTAIAARKLLCGKIKIKLLGVGMIETFTSLLNDLTSFASNV